MLDPRNPGPATPLDVFDDRGDEIHETGAAGSPDQHQSETAGRKSCQRKTLADDRHFILHTGAVPQSGTAASVRVKEGTYDNGSGTVDRQ
jgi:hypothetical protein